VSHFRLVGLVGLVDRSGRVLQVGHRVPVRHCRLLVPVLQNHLQVQVRRECLASFEPVVLVHRVHRRCLVHQGVLVGRSVPVGRAGRCFLVVLILQVGRDFRAIHSVLVVLAVQAGTDYMAEFRPLRKRLAVVPGDQVHLVLLARQVFHSRPADQGDPDVPVDSIPRIPLVV
jgi:hypothetical protein